LRAPPRLLASKAGNDVSIKETAKFSIRHCALRPHTPDVWVLASNGLSESCPKIGDVPKFPVPHIGSPGAVGLHNDASNKEFGSRAGAHERPGIRASLTGPCVSSKGKEMGVGRSAEAHFVSASTQVTQDAPDPPCQPLLYQPRPGGGLEELESHYSPQATDIVFFSIIGAARRSNNVRPKRREVASFSRISPSSPVPLQNLTVSGSLVPRIRGGAA
jgi:hypothetical protein